MLEELEIQGFKSLRDSQVPLRPLNVLIGANGAGKSNLVSFFRMLNYMMTGALQTFIARSGYASSILHHGPRKTPQLSARLSFRADKGKSTYEFRLAHAAGDILIFTEEKLQWLREGHARPQVKSLGAGHKEAQLNVAAEEGGNALARTIRYFLTHCRFYQFHDTSETSRIRGNVELENNKYLMSDGGNLAAVLGRWRETKRSHYERIVSVVRQVAPFFGDFVLDPLPENPRFTRLRWRSTDSEYEFGPHQLSDGTLRVMALVSLLYQPEDELPDLMVLDEPELGLHPSAISAVASLAQGLAQSKQLILATQSKAFLDQFAGDDVLVVELQEGASSFRRLDQAALKEWLAEYSLSQLWDKNVLGGRPSR